MDCMFSFTTDTKTYAFYSSEHTRSVLKIAKIQKHILIKNVLVTYCGENSDYSRIILYAKEMAYFLNRKYNLEINGQLITNIIKNILYENLRKSELKCTFIVNTAEKIYSIDQYGAVKVDDYGIFGMGIYFLYGIFDKYYRRNMNDEEAENFAKMCLNTLSEKSVIKNEFKFLILSEGQLIENDDFF